MTLRMDPITIVIGIILLGYVVSDSVSNYQDKHMYRELAQQNLSQAERIVAMAGNVQEANNEIKNLVYRQSEIEAKYQNTIKEKDKKVGEQFSILATQAVTIAKTTPAGDTRQHAAQAVTFMKEAGAVLIDVGLAWNTAYAQQASNELAQLKAQLAAEQLDKARIAENLRQTSDKAAKLSEDLKSEAVAHASTAQQVKTVISELSGERSIWARTKKMITICVWIAVFLGICYVGFHVYQVLSLKKSVNLETLARREANKAKYEAEALANELKTATKTFLMSGPEGNDQMIKILSANGLKKHFEDAMSLAAQGQPGSMPIITVSAPTTQVPNGKQG